MCACVCVRVCVRVCWHHTSEEKSIKKEKGVRERSFDIGERRTEGSNESKPRRAISREDEIRRSWLSMRRERQQETEREILREKEREG